MIVMKIFNHSVVVGPCKLSVSDRMAHNNMPAVALVGLLCRVMKVCAMMVLMDPHGRISM